MNESIISTLADIKSDFYDWCWLLSLDEVASNERLRFAIERIEKMLFAMGR